MCVCVCVCVCVYGGRAIWENRIRRPFVDWVGWSEGIPICFPFRRAHAPYPNPMQPYNARPQRTRWALLVRRES